MFLSSYEPLIPIEDGSSSDEPDTNDQLLSSTLKHSGLQLQADISKLKQESTLRFKTRWDEIIAKYSSVDELESDEVDLATGEITIDNGHLRSLTTSGTEINGVKVNTSIWHGDYDDDRDLQKEKKREESQAKRKQKLREQLKMERKFHNPGVVTSDSDVLEDNLVSSSPAKSRRLYLGNSSPLKFHLESPFKVGLSPLKLVSSPVKIGFSRQSSDSSLLASPTKRRHVQKSPGDSKGLGADRLEPFDSGISQLLLSTPENQHSSDNSEVDTLYLMISDLHEHTTVAVFNCAFNGCTFHSESKASYRAHLLSQHSGQLNQIGYPVTSADTSFKHHQIPELTILKLTLHFPLQVNLPPIVRSCGLYIDNQQCLKVFADLKLLKLHQEGHPRGCSTRKQVFACPILGCDFLTDEGYAEFREHVIGHNGKKEETKKFNGIATWPEQENDPFSGRDSPPERYMSAEGDPLPYDSFSASDLVDSVDFTPKQVPKLEILDNPHFDYQFSKEDEGGYSSIEELFNED